MVHTSVAQPEVKGNVILMMFCNVILFVCYPRFELHVYLCFILMRFSLISPVLLYFCLDISCIF